MKLFLLVLLAATIIGGFAGGEIADISFSIVGAVVGGVGTAAVLLGLGAYFTAQDKKSKKLSPEMREVFDRMVTGKTNPTAQEIKAAKAALRGGGKPAGNREILLAALEEISPHIEDKPVLFYPTIKKRVEQIIMKTSPSDLAQSLAGTTPVARILHIVASLCFDIVATGRYHVHRGVLNMEGEAIRDMALSALAELQKRNVLPREEAESSRAELYEVIKSMG